MRKVIAYIASHFRKDKIWLRRTRPDQRTYQVTLPPPPPSYHLFTSTYISKQLFTDCALVESGKLELARLAESCSVAQEVLLLCIGCCAMAVLYAWMASYVLGFAVMKFTECLQHVISSLMKSPEI